MPKVPTNAPIVSPAPTISNFTYTPSASPTQNPQSPFYNYNCYPADAPNLGLYCAGNYYYIHIIY